MNPVAGHGSAGEELVNRERSIWSRVTQAAVVLLVVVAGSSVGFLAATEPRLLTWAEVVPPDESLVGALLPATILLGLTVVVLGRLRHVPPVVTLRAEGVSFGQARSGERTVYPWAEIEVAPGGNRWEGVAVRARSGGGRAVTVFVDRRLAERLRLGREGRNAPNPTSGPER